MKILEFLKDKGLFLSINLIIFLIIAAIMIAIKVSSVIIFIIFCMWFLPLLSYITIEYIRYKRYFNSVQSIMDNLDKKYLLPEIIDEQNFIVGEMVNDILKTLSRDMHENINIYREMQKEYREYIETWVHEIKTPIASSKLIIENNNNDVTKKIDMQIDKIENFVEQVLYYSRSNEVDKDYVIREVELEQIVKKVVKKNYRDFINKKISLELDEIDEIIYSDTKWIEFIINQIIGNSIKYTKGKEDVIKIASKELNNSVILIVEDNGVGIIEKDIKRVFEKGFTGDNGRRFGKSTGIGMYLCKKLCDKLGVGLIIESQLNKGTKVSMIFPKYKEIIINK
jgi:signal transduction histidine kinase